MAKKLPAPEPDTPVAEPLSELVADPEAAPKKGKEKESKYPTRRKRYEVSIAKKDDPQCFVLFAETDTFVDAQQQCTAKAFGEERECIVFDNVEAQITFREKPLVDDMPPSTIKPKPKRWQ